MNTTVSKSFGLALLLAVGIIAVMVAMGAFTSERAGAQVEDAADSIQIKPAEPAPGAAVQVELTVDFDDGVVSFGTLEIELKGFGLPDQIDPKHVLLRNTQSGGNNVGNPLDVDVSGGVITLELNDDEDDGTVAIPGAQDNVVIVIRKRAGLTAPALAGRYDVRVGDITAKDAVTVSAVLKLDPTKGGSGTDIDVSGKAFANGTGTLYTKAAGDTNGDGKALKDVTVADGAFSTTVAAKDLTTADNGMDNGMSVVTMVDANGDRDTATFTVTGTTTLGADSVRKGRLLKISIADWISEVPDKVKIGGVPLVIIDANEVPIDPVALTDKAATLYVKVTAEVRLGTKTVVLFDGDVRLDSATVEITALGLSVSPSSAVAGQEVTVEGTGFNTAADNQLKTLTVGGESQTDLSNRNAVADYDVLSGGRIVISFDVPDGVTHGSKTIQVTDDDGRVGEVSLTVPKPTITLDPAESRRGTTVSVSGTGFPANENIMVDYGPGEDGIATGRTGDTGNFSASFVIPSDATIGGEVKVKASFGGDDYSAEATHTVPDKAITVTPDVVQSGDTVEIDGTGFPRYSDVMVKIGEGNFRNTNARTDDVGDFTVSVIIPGIDTGTHVIQVDAGDSIGTWVITVPDTPIARAIGDVFKALIDNGSLNVVWRYDITAPAGERWTSYTTDPDTAFANDLFEVEGSDILNINVDGEQTFSHQRGDTIPDGWSLITLN